MRLLKPITIAGVLLLAQLTAFGAELAVLRNGFSIRFERKEQNGNITRLYTGSGYLDVTSEQIASFETEEAPVPPQPEAVPQPLGTGFLPRSPCRSAAPEYNLTLIIRKKSFRASPVTESGIPLTYRRHASRLES